MSCPFSSSKMWKVSRFLGWNPGGVRLSPPQIQKLIFPTTLGVVFKDGISICIAALEKKRFPDLSEICHLVSAQKSSFFKRVPPTPRKTNDWNHRNLKLPQLEKENIFWLVFSTHLKNISQIENLPQGSG